MISETLALIRKATDNGYSYNVIKEVYDRGVDAWTPEEYMTPRQYAFNRVNSFIAEGKARMLDNDLVKDDDVEEDIDKEHEAKWHPEGKKKKPKPVAVVKAKIEPATPKKKSRAWQAAERHVEKKKIEHFKGVESRKLDRDIHKEKLRDAEEAFPGITDQLGGKKKKDTRTLLQRIRNK